MLKEMAFNAIYAKKQITLANKIIKNGIYSMNIETSFKSGREMYREIHGDNNFLALSIIHQNNFLAKILSLLLLAYLISSIWFMDVYGLLFSLIAYYFIVIVTFQYPLWMNHYKCIIGLRLFLTQTLKNKNLWFWYINSIYIRNKNGF